MIEEEYVSFETAKLLKEKGFNEKVICYYDDGGSLNLNKFVEFQCCNQGYGSGVFAAPTLQMACKWLREKHNIDICAFPEHYDYILWGYTCKIYKNKEQFCSSENFKLYEEAVEAAIKYCLENLI